ncbi:molybdopterin-guanine dinucleotide biosynthesis protein B [Paenibacillus sp. MMS20-IR301]|uniref:molybdopterin-guanine dinucleotide biosynthesis protein B n=1 Tax=Paenibacillus sp. MMS20-IR301 TaxID=2895946 RepID=UPI0028E96B92|nr:molybdopterin-guanine dinucleotide biosynthesis protein B [Paenibacillus sp. MMS20-IR301]WNS40692.1 molybdopterin-guanine dinucleotide biosynthesis protein B [Paenibacillus sp. MMS20-IR301]
MTGEVYHKAAQGTVPVLQIIGYKNSGKTTLACRLIDALTSRGIRAGSAKHDAHEFQLDDPDTDSSKHLLHGAVETVLTSMAATRIMRRSGTTLDEIARSMYGRADLLIAEGFKSAHYPKIALIRSTDEMIALGEQATDIRLWLSWEANADLDSLAAKTPGGNTAPVLQLQNQALADQEILSLALSLL